MAWWIWLLLGLFLLFVEVVTPGGFFFVFFGAGALVVGLLAGLNIGGPLWLQWLLFTLFSVVALLLFRKPLLEKVRRSERVGEVDSLVGEAAVVLQEMAADAVGKVELRGTAWNARNAGGSMLVAGQRCTVEKIEGLMLYVRG